MEIPALLYWILGGIAFLQLLMLVSLMKTSARVKRLMISQAENSGGRSSRRSSGRSSSASRKEGASAGMGGVGEEDDSRWDGSGRTRAAAVASEEEKISDEMGKSDQKRQFREFLHEDPARQALTKKEQFEAFRRWRDAKGLNWRGS